MLLEGTGHVIRMDQGRRDKKIFETKSEGSRRTGIPGQRWLEDMREDLREDLRETKVRDGDRRQSVGKKGRP